MQLAGVEITRLEPDIEVAEDRSANPGNRLPREMAVLVDVGQLGRADRRVLVQPGEAYARAGGRTGRAA